MDIKLIGTTIINWQEFNNFCQKHLEKSPLRELDNAGIDSKSMSAFALILGKNFKHHCINFVGLLDQTLIILCQDCGLVVTAFTPSVARYGMHLFVCVISGSIFNWITLLAHQTKDEQKQLLISCVYVYLKKAGFNPLLKELFDECVEGDLITLERK